MKIQEHNLSWMAAALAAALAAGGASAETLRVTGDRVNVRAKPGFENSEVLGQLAYDQRVERVRDEDEWVGVVPPDNISFWVHGDYVRPPENVVTATRVNLRAGPSVNYTALGTVERGSTVTVRRSLDGWLEIEPPEGTCVWVYRDYVEPLDGGATATAAAAEQAPPAEEPVGPAFPASVPAPAEPAIAFEPPPSAPPAANAVLPAPLPLPVATTTNASAMAKPPARSRRRYTRTDADLPVTPIPVPSAEVRPAAGTATPIVAPSNPSGGGAAAEGLPAKLKLVPLDGQGRPATYEGVLRAAPLFNDGPTRYRVLVWQDNRWQILCHVVGEAAKFRALQDKHVRVRGKEYWVQDTAAPVLVPEQIQEIVLEEAPK